MAVDAVVDNLKSISKAVTTPEEIAQVGITIYAHRLIGHVNEYVLFWNSQTHSVNDII